MKPRSPRRIIVALSVLAFVGIVLMALRPVTTPNRSNTRYVEAEVLNVYAGDGENDIVIELSGHDDSFYINRGLEKNLDIQDLQSALLGEKIELVYISHWTPLRNITPRHIAEISKKGQIIYTELKD